MKPLPDHEFEGEIRLSPDDLPQRARVSFNRRGLAIVINSRSERKWPYRTLAAKPVSPAQDYTTVTSAREPGARLTVASPQFSASLLQMVPSASGRKSRGPIWLPIVVVSLVVLAIVGGLAWAAVFFLPYKEVARTIPDATRNSIGEITIASLAKDHKECKAVAGRAALDKLVERIAKADRDDAIRRGDRVAARRAFRVNIVDWDLVNAFAVIGDQIVLTRALIDRASSPEDVAGVIAHEMGHAIELHPEASVLRSVGTVAVVQILIGGWSPDLFKQAGTRLLLLRHSRGAEREADDLAFKLLKRAGISAKGLADFFARLQIEDKGNGSENASRMPNFLASHPPLPERAGRLSAQPVYPATPALDTAEWHALRDICQRD